MAAKQESRSLFDLLPDREKDQLRITYASQDAQGGGLKEEQLRGALDPLTRAFRRAKITTHFGALVEGRIREQKILDLLRKGLRQK